MKIKFFHFIGPGTDLKVGLSPRAVFKGGTALSARNVDFEPNLPTEECFTTPDYRMTEGKARTTRPFLINGKQIRGLSLEFKNGEISNFHAEEGQKTFEEYINSDGGSKRLGEVALVGIDSPIYQSGRIFEEILFDENAACHIAIGFAYRFCIEGSEEMSNEELDKIGCNTSHVHTDMMLSSDEVDVHAELYSGQKIQLIKNGTWLKF
jgi:aminopeptidase